MIFQVAEDTKCQAMSVMATSPHTRKIFSKLDFDILRYIESKSFLEDFKNGRSPIFPGVDSSLHFKILDQFP